VIYEAGCGIKFFLTRTPAPPRNPFILIPSNFSQKNYKNHD
jgi:hypothetical protein